MYTICAIFIIDDVMDTPCSDLFSDTKRLDQIKNCKVNKFEFEFDNKQIDFQNHQNLIY